MSPPPSEKNNSQMLPKAPSGGFMLGLGLPGTLAQKPPPRVFKSRGVCLGDRA